MRSMLRVVAKGALAVLFAASAAYGYAWWNSERALARVYAIDDAPLQLPADAAGLDHGRHLYRTRGCIDCHGPGGEGKLVADAGPVIRVVAPNITPQRLAARGYDADAVAAAMRHGLRVDGRPLVFMPAGDWSELGDGDTAALVAYLGTLPASANEPGATEVRPLGRVLHALGKFPLLPAEHVDHAPRPRVTPAAVASVEYGAYVAAVCSGCHRPGLVGGAPVAPDTPPVPGLTPATLGQWSEADFFRAMREGRRPDGSAIDPFMPWQAFGGMTDVELRAIWRHLQSLPDA